MSLKSFMILIRKNKHQMTRQQIRTLRGQALAGDIAGAVKGLNKIIKNV